MKCTSCGFDNPTGVKFCGNCGARLEAPCAVCGFTNPPGFKFCGQCGNPLPAASTSSTLRPQASAAGAPQLGQPDTSPAAERRQLTVMFCDLVGSTQLSQQLDPEDLRDILHAYQELSNRVIRRFDGHIAKYLGDGILVYFGYPVAHEDDAHRAVRAGLGIVEGMERLNSRLVERYGVRIATRVGIDTGVVVVGELGIGEAREPMGIVGETANVASRLQEVAEPNTVVISSATYRLVDGYFDHQPLGSRALKGIARPMPAYRSVQESGARSRLDVTAGRGLTPLVGRQQETGLVLSSWERARDRVGSVVLITGEAGIGKSRLVQVAKEQVAADPEAWLTPCQCSPYYQHSALHPIVDLLQRIVLDFKKDETPDQQRSKLEGWLAQYDLAEPQDVNLFASLLSLPLIDTDSPPGLSPDQQKARTLQLLLRIFLERAAHQPMLFVVEDLQWADATTLELLNLVIDQGPTSRMLALFTARPEFVSPWTGRSHVVHISLHRLSRRQVIDMVQRLTRGKALPPEVLEQLVARTDGVPLFVEELTKMVLESGLLQEHSDRYELTAPLPALAIPTTLHDSLMARLDRLSSVRELAQLCAVIGREFSYELLRRVVGTDDATLRHGLTALVDAELLYQRGVLPDATYIFKHQLIQDTAYLSLLKSKRSQIHERVARALETDFADSVARQPELLAHHFTEAGRAEQALPYWRQAAENAQRVYANPEAIGIYERALALLAALPPSRERDETELGLCMGLGVSLVATEGYGSPDVTASYQRAYVLCERLGIPVAAPILRAKAIGTLAHGPANEPLDWAQQLVDAAAQTADTITEVEGHYARGVTRFWTGALADSRRDLETALARFDPRFQFTHLTLYAQDPKVICHCRLALTLWHLGFAEQAERHLDDALTRAARLGHPYSQVYALAYAAWLANELGQADVARQRAETVIRQGEAHRLRFWPPSGRAILGAIMSAGGEREQGLALVHQSIQTYTAASDRLHLPYAFGLLANVYSDAGDRANALAAVDEGLEVTEWTGYRYWEPELLRRRGDLLAQDSAHLREAQSVLHTGLNIARRQEALVLELRAAMSLLRLARASDDSNTLSSAVARLNDVYDRFTEGHTTPDLRAARSLLDDRSAR